jgi:hypothetical protein
MSMQDYMLPIHQVNNYYECERNLSVSIVKRRVVMKINVIR